MTPLYLLIACVGVACFMGLVVLVQALSERVERRVWPDDPE